MAIIGLEDDIGFAVLLFTLFIGLLWVATGPRGLPLLGLRCSSRVGAYIAAHYFGQVHLRVEQWQTRGPHPNPGNASWPRRWYSMAQGGVGGTGLGFDHVRGPASPS